MSPVVADAPFVGRVEQVSRLGELLDAAAGGQPAAVLVGGDAGVGKTRFAGAVEELARGRGFVVASGRSVDLGAGGLPYLAFVDAVRSVSRDGGTAAEVVRRATQEWPVLLRLVGRSPDGASLAEADRLPLFDAVASLLARLADQVAPVLVVLEDVHWADASTRDLLRFLLSRLRAERLLVAVTFRTDDLHRRHPLRPLLAELIRLPRVERIDLAPFDRADLARLLATVAGGAVPAAVVDDIAGRSGGNAFFALELLAAGGPGETAAAMPEALTDVLLARMEELSPTAQHVVRTASVAGQCVDDDLLRRVLAAGSGGAPDGADLDAALREAADRRVLVPCGPLRYTFRHALLQEAVYADLLPGERVGLHAGYAQALADAAGQDDDVVADLAQHALRSHDLAAALAASWRAARAAQDRLAPLDAFEHAEQALGLWDAVPAGRRPAGVTHVDLLLHAASLAGSSGDVGRARVLATSARDEALADGDPVTVGRARRHLARHLYAAERLEECIAEATQAREILLAHPPSEDLVWATAILATARTNHEKDERTAELARTGLALARDLGLVAAEADLLVSLALLEGDLAGDVLGAEHGLLAARDLARAAGETAIELRAQWNLGVARHEVDDLAAAADLYREVDVRARATGLAASLYAVEARLSLTEVLYRLGRWAEALDVARAEGLRLAPRDTRALRGAALRVTAAREPRSVPAAAAAIREDAARAGEQRLGSFEGAALRITEAVAALWAGDADEAVRHVESALAVLDAGSQADHLVAVRACAVGLSALAAGGRPPGPDTVDSWLARAERSFARAQPMRGRQVGPEGRAWLLRARAEHARAVGGGAGAAQAWAQVLPLVTGQPFDEAQVRLRWAEALAAAGARDEAAGQLRVAHARAKALQAGPLREAVDAVARRYRLDPGAGVPPSDGPLTPREAQVLRLVAEGLTNRAIGERLHISEKTASVHVSNILGKLGASGRAEAVAVAGRRGLLPG